MMIRKTSKICAIALLPLGLILTGCSMPSEDPQKFSSLPAFRLPAPKSTGNPELDAYQAKVSHAVQLEWQRNCLLHRDSITPGYLTTQFQLTPSGKVKAAKFTSTHGASELQKSFTLSSIRDAKIPAMPEKLAAQYQEKPLELIFNFYF